MADDLVDVPGATEWFVRQFRWPNSVMLHYTSKEACEAILNAVWLTFKDGAWSMESEFRYVYHVWDEHLPDWCTIQIRPDTGWRYIVAEFEPAGLKYVGNGPRNDPLTSRLWVDDIMRRNGFEGVHISQSTL